MPLPGWYPDPRREAKSRWHDGENWTERTSDGVDGPETDATIDVAEDSIAGTSTRPPSLKSRVNRWAPLVGVLIGVALVLNDVLNDPGQERRQQERPVSDASTASVGDAFSLDAGETNVLVRLNDVVDPVLPGEQDTPPRPGTHLVGVELTIKNVGDQALSGTLISAVNLEGTDHSGTLMRSLREGECNGEWLKAPSLAAGDKRSGCIAFSLPDGETPRLFQLQTNSGAAQNMGQWEL